MNQEGLVPEIEPSLNPLSFVVVGAGEVFLKYWIPADHANIVNISRIIDLRPQEEVLKTPEYESRYQQTTGLKETLDLIRETSCLNVAVVIPPGERLDLVESILNELPTKRVFIEKPFANNGASLTRYKELAVSHHDRMHFAGKYAQGRAKTMLELLPNIAPSRIKASLVEGTRYFQKMSAALRKNGSHPFLEVGPELDLGFHLLDIAGAVLLKAGYSLSEAEVCYETVADLSASNASFTPGYGFSATISVAFKDGVVIPFEIMAGKAPGPHDRQFEIIYPNGVSYRQVYSTPGHEDPVYNHLGVIVAQHPKDYQYYAQELSPTSFGKQTLTQMLIALRANEICLELKKARQANS